MLDQVTNISDTKGKMTINIVGVKSHDLIKAQVIIPTTAEAGTYPLTISNDPNNKPATVNFTLDKQPAPNVTDTLYNEEHTPPTVNPDKAQSIKLTLKGTHLAGAELKLPAESEGKIDIESQAVKSDDKLVAQISIPAKTRDGSYPIKIANKGGEQTISFKVDKQPDPDELKITSYQSESGEAITLTADSTKPRVVKIVINGKNLEGATLSVPAAYSRKLQLIDNSLKSNGPTEFTVRINVLTEAGADKYNLEVSNTSGTKKPLAFEIK